MRNVSATFLAAIGAPHDLITSMTYTVPGGSPVTMSVKSGAVACDTSQRTRRTINQMSVYGTLADYKAITTPGTAFHIDHGFDYQAGQTEVVPVFHGELTNAVQQVGDGTITLALADHMNWIARCGFVVPFNPPASMTRIQAITSIVQTAKPGTTVNVTATDTGTVGSQAMWTNSAVDAITALCRDGAMDAYFQADGSFLICDLPSASTASVWTARGIVKSVARQRPFDKLYNTVVVQPSATDGSQTWPQQVAQIQDTTNPRHPNNIGVVPLFWSSPTITTATAAMQAAQALLFRALGTTETLSLETLSNPALEGNDLIRVVIPAVNGEPDDIKQHFIDTFSLDLVTGAMTTGTRSQPVSIT
ncbi:hypothetical protein [Leifsonia sp. P73]|uniref:hypothetical protein n=1 Tax=Leifsonia sp. P73 TaxID=3423959 RepID=UPI003DA5C281